MKPKPRKRAKKLTNAKKRRLGQAAMDKVEATFRNLARDGAAMSRNIKP